jgi:hypothetical protein
VGEETLRRIGQEFSSFIAGGDELRYPGRAILKRTWSGMTFLRIVIPL